ncbi:MAG TPA: R3H domain-containing nucleic acid-binding protein [Candidatus Moranbacteria bacterium]|nr:R3H domain-containing nucleic acid-binding protein [Candidatus Moranbacteria bacterium]
MDKQKDQALIKQVVGEILEKMGFQASLEVEAEAEGNEEENFLCKVSSPEDSHLLIGQHGANLEALQHLARLVVRRRTDSRLKFTLDINDYRKERNATVVEAAKQAADQAAAEKRTITLRPMSTYERRLVHLEISKRSDVTSDSVGEGEERKVAIRPISSQN